MSFLYDATTIYTLSSLTVKLVPGFEIEDFSKIEINVPDVTENNPYIQNTVSCDVVSNIDGPLTCTLTGNKLIVSGGFLTPTAAGTEISFKINNVYTPLSTSRYTGFTAYFTQADGIRYMKWETGYVEVSGSRTLPTFNVNLDDDSVGATTILLISLTPFGFVYQDFYLEILSDGVIDMQNAVPLSGALKGAASANRIAIEPNASWRLKNSTATNVYISGVINRNWAQSGSITIKIYDANDKIA